MLYITSSWLTYFITGSLYILTIFTHFAHPIPLPLATTNPLSTQLQFLFFLKTYAFICSTLIYCIPQYVTYCYVEIPFSSVQSLSSVQLCDPMDYSPLGSSVYGILQARILEWVAISYSRGSSQPRGQTRVSCVLHCRQILYHWAIGKAPV